jgi:hypothetical protein
MVMTDARGVMLATCPEAGFRDGPRAVSLARRACEATDWKHPYYLGTLGATLAEIGDFDEAARWQAEALALYPAEEKPAGEARGGTQVTKALVFISYATADRETARRITDELGAVRIPVWRDDLSVQPGQNWVAEIQRGLEDAGYLLALLSRASLDSQWVQHEWTAMLARQLASKNGGIIIPLRLENVQPPELLRPLQYVDLFPDFDAGMRKVVGFLLSETRPAWLVQQEMKAMPSFAQAADAAALRDPSPMILERSTGYSSSTWTAWHNVMGQEPLTDAALQQLDNRTIRRIALRCVTQQGLQSFCFDTSTDQGSLSGTSLNERILSLLEQLVRDGRLEEFVRWLAEESTRCVRAGVEQFLPQVLAPSGS